MPSCFPTSNFRQKYSVKPRKIHNVSEKMTTRQSKPKLATLPLPRELRDHIYGYLLTTTFLVESDWIGHSPSSLPLQVYSRPAILDVSISTRQEAKQALYRNAISSSTLTHHSHLLHGTKSNIFRVLSCCRILLYGSILAQIFGTVAIQMRSLA
ncbi:hypothetical protein BDR22DRAFT_433911 [Usnea florida]